MQHGETVHSALPWDIPWWMSDHFVFFGVLYLVLMIVGTGVGWVVLQSLMQLKGGNASGHH
ncbi:MAG: hypothetical protein AB7E47_11265 [Desulfovibrionaceae bacterium]